MIPTDGKHSIVNGRIHMAISWQWRLAIIIESQQKDMSKNLA